MNGMRKLKFLNRRTLLIVFLEVQVHLLAITSMNCTCNIFTALI